MHKKEFWILTEKYGNNLKHENEAEEPWAFSLVFVFTVRLFPYLLVKIKNSFLCLWLFVIRSFENQFLLFII